MLKRGRRWGVLLGPLSNPPARQIENTTKENKNRTKNAIRIKLKKKKGKPNNLHCKAAKVSPKKQPPKPDQIRNKYI